MILQRHQEPTEGKDFSLILVRGAVHTCWRADVGECTSAMGVFSVNVL